MRENQLCSVCMRENKEAVGKSGMKSELLSGHGVLVNRAIWGKIF